MQWLFQVWGCREEPRVISAYREFQVTGTQSVHIPSAQDANIGDKRKKGEISGWVIWAGLAGKGQAPRRGCVALPIPLPLPGLGARKQHVTALIKGCFSALCLSGAKVCAKWYGGHGKDLVSTHEEFSSVWSGRKTIHTHSIIDQLLAVIQQTFLKCLCYARKRALKVSWTCPLPSTGCVAFSACPHFGCFMFLYTPPLTPNEGCILGHVGLGKSDLPVLSAACSSSFKCAQV